MRFEAFRAILRDVVIEQLDSNKPVALLFSGGTDSLVILWTLLDLEARVTCYTFKLEQNKSEDFKAAQLACKTWNTPLIEVTIPYQSTTNLLIELRQLIGWMQTDRKTAIECTWPFTYIVPRIKEEQVWCGLNADDLWGSAREMAIRYSKKPEEFKAKRLALLADPYTAAWYYIERLFTESRRTLLSPYRHPRIIEYLLSFNWQELNRPRQKMPAYTAFEKEFSQVPIWRRNDNLQCGSGIREYLARLLSHQGGNIEGHSNMISLYGEILRQETTGYIYSQPRLV